MRQSAPPPKKAAMPAQILDGKALAAEMREDIRQRVAARKKRGQRPPGLAVILVGSDAASRIYVRNKHQACVDVGFISRAHDLSADTSEAKLLALIDEL